MRMAKPFRDALLEAVAATGTNLRKVADGANVSYEQLKKVRQRPDASTNVDDAIKVANFFGFTLDEFLSDETATDRAAIVATYFQLSQQERLLLKATGRGLDALDHAAKPK